MKTMASNYKDFLNHMETVTDLYIKSTEEFDPSKLTRIKSLNLSFRKQKEFPEGLVDLKNLKALIMSHNKFSTLPDSFKSLSNLWHINFEKTPFEEIPSVILEMKQLEILNMKGCALKKMPQRFCLPNLKHIDFSYNYGIDNRVFLDAIMYLPALESYRLPHTMSLKYSYGQANPEVYYFEKFFALICKKRKDLIRKDGLAQGAIEALCWLFKQDKAQLEKIKKPVFYSLLNCTSAKYRDMALNHLADISQGKLEKIEGKKLFILGKLKMKRGEQAAWIAETGASLEKKFSAEVDYVVLGEKPKDKLQEVLASGVKILMERDVWEIKDSAYLMEENTTDLSENLIELLHSSDPANLDIALQLMEQGGVPEDILEELIGLMLFHTNNKIRKRSKLVFDRYLSVDLPENTTKALAKQAYRIKEDKKVTLFLRELVRGTSLDLDALAYAVYRASGKQQAQGLCLSLPKVSSKVINDYLDKHGFLELKPHTRLANGLFLERLPAAIEELASKGGAIRLDRLKFKDDKEYLRLKGVKKLYLNLARSKKMPATIFSNTALEELDLTLYSVKKIDPSIGNLNQLKRLRIYAGALEKMPKEISKLSQLKSLTLTKKEGEFPRFILALKNLEYLYLGSSVSDLPMDFAKLDKLKLISIKLLETCSKEEHDRLKTLKALAAKRKEQAL